MGRRTAGIAAAAALALLASTPATAAADGGRSAAPQGERSLAALLTSDGNRFDRDWHDYDIVTEAVLAVLGSKPTSPVALLADGTSAATAFVPSDRAFRSLVKSLTGRAPRTEAATFRAVAALGIDTVETVLLYHVVPGATVTYKAALRSDGAALVSAQGGAITVDVHRWWRWRSVELEDLDPNARNPIVVRPNLNKGNKQIAHGIDRVLRPLDL